MAKDVLFTRETFLAAMRREKKRKQEWEEKMNKNLDDLQEKKLSLQMILISMIWLSYANLRHKPNQYSCAISCMV